MDPAKILSLPVLAVAQTARTEAEPRGCCPVSPVVASVERAGFGDGPTAPPTIDEMTARMKAGDDDAFALFYELYCDRLFRYLIVLTRSDHELARDLLQVTLLKVVRGMHRFSSERELWHWLAAIARNSFIDALRQQQRRPQSTPAMAELPAIPAPETADNQLFLALEKSMADLSPEENALVETFYFEGASYQSLAVENQTTAKAIESKLARIRQKLRATMQRILQHENT